MTSVLRVLTDAGRHLWRGQLHAQSVYLAELHPWSRPRTDCEPLHWRRHGSGWRLHGDVVPAPDDGHTL